MPWKCVFLMTMWEAQKYGASNKSSNANGQWCTYMLLKHQAFCTILDIKKIIYNWLYVFEIIVAELMVNLSWYCKDWQANKQSF